MYSYFRNLFMGTLFLFLITNCGADNNSPELKTVQGPKDDRISLNASDFQKQPFSALGYLDTGCSGFLVGERMVATAARCVVDKDTGELRPKLRYFRMGFVENAAVFV